MMSKGIFKKGKTKLIRLIFSRLGIVLILFLIHIAILFFAFYQLESFLPQIWGGTTVLTAVVVIYVVNCPMNPQAKITWLVLIMVAPVFGSLLFAYTKSDIGHRALKKRAQMITEGNKKRVAQNTLTLNKLRKKDNGIAKLAEYISKTGCYPVYDATEVEYFPSGEAKFEALLKALEGAKKFIFLEYFIISEGKMWGEVLDVLSRKVKEGVEVRVIYDGTCEFTTLSQNYPKKLKKLGIRCRVFAPLTPFLSTHYNYRDHRKIAVIDGEFAFCGGINLADEYINEKERFGHWKDSAVMLKGDAVESFTLMFLDMWNMEEKKLEYEPYIYSPPSKNDGFVLPFSDCPTDEYKTGERVYMDILNRATDHVYIMSPYLIIDNEMETALRFASERGVDVSIILPGIPDKKGAWALAKTHYKALISSGVKLYEYSVGFVHSKVFVADSREAVVGTINLDYRSLYHHFECATYFAYSSPIAEIEKDFHYTLDKCVRVTPETIKKEKLHIKALGVLLKAIAPLM